MDVAERVLCGEESPEGEAYGVVIAELACAWRA
jgi:hypothetical protein